MDKLVHTTVLLQELIDGLALEKGDVYLDGTLGSGGHTLLAAERLQGNITVIGIDRDQNALERSKKRLEGKVKDTKNLHLVRESYRNLDIVLESLGIKQVNRIMLDLGLSSDQFETSGRGFTFRKDEPLLMTFKDAADLTPDDLTAKEIVNTWQEENIADIIYGYGEERYSRRIAREIVRVRELKKIETTFELVEIIKVATPGRYHHGKIHPATRTFQALRIAVNDELNALRDGLRKGFEKLAPSGRMAIISFHSLEDRIVKHFYKQLEEESSAALITKKPIAASEEEIQKNPRSRSAKLRIIQK